MFRGLKSLVQGLKDAIKKNEMLDKDVEFHRKRSDFYVFLVSGVT